MYSGKMQHRFLQSQLNLQKVLLQRNNQDLGQALQKYAVTLKGGTAGPFLNVSFIHFLKSCLLALPEHWKNESSNMIRVWTRQCECVFAQRIRRSQQMFSLYTRLWEEQALRQFLKNVRLQVTKHGKEFVFSAIGVVAYNWDKNRIAEAEMRSHLPELEYIKILKEKTIMCQVCNRIPDKIDKNIIVFCDCEGRKSMQTFDNWTLFIEQPELIVWRRLHASGSFEYKVYGTYNDVSAEDFLSVQMDTDYRKQWDPTAVALEVVESDLQPNSNSDVVYWEMQWPRLFANRDYVFNRKFLVDKSKKTVMLLSKGTEHPEYPSRPNKYRVSDYWSSMVIKPYTEIDMPGIEFSLTYFDNPGVNIPQAVTSWVAYRAMPDFLTRLRAATKEYKKYCSANNCRGVYSFKPKEQEPRKLESSSVEVESCEPTESGDDIFGALRDSLPKEDPPAPTRQLDTLYLVTEADKNKALEVSSPSPAELMLTPTPIAQTERSYWKYLHPAYYIS